MHGRLLILGSGGSMGVPVIGCDCPVCTSTDPKNKRTRTAALLVYNGRQILIDSGPDFRIQALNCQLKHLDGVILTHAHYDHTAGLDDLRPLMYRAGKPIPTLMSKSTLDDLKIRFYYFFEREHPKLSIELLEAQSGVQQFLGITFQYFTYTQLGMDVNGFRVGDIAYVSDIKEYSNDIFKSLYGVKVLILSALRHTASPVHLSVDEAIEFANKCRAEKTYLTHIAHDLDHNKTEAYLPPNVRMAYDGLEIAFQDEKWPK